jgi:hypothetical protein
MTIDFDGLNAAACARGRSLVEELLPGGKISGAEYIVRNPSRNDREPGSFSINWRSGRWADFATNDKGGDFISLVAYIRDIGQGEAARQLADTIGFPLSHRPNGNSAPREPDTSGNGVHRGTATDTEHNHVPRFPPRTTPDADGRPKFFIGGDKGPRVTDNELRRHVYRREGVPVRVKIKFRNGGWSNWYRVTSADGKMGWQSGRPEGYADVPYITLGSNPFDPEVLDDLLLWPEGEKDVDTTTNLGFLAFTFGGTGDGLPAAITKYIAGRDVVILGDNDVAGHQHTQEKVALAHKVAKSVRVFAFPEKDVSDWSSQGHTAEELSALVDAAPLLLPPTQHPANVETSKPIKFNLVPFDDLRSSGTTEYVLKGLFPRRGLAIVWGPPKCGKSFWVFTVMMHVAMAREYRGHRVHQCEVVYLALEGQSGFGNRAEAFRQCHLQQGEKVPAFKLSGASLDLIKDHPQLIDDIRRQSVKPGCVVIDTMNRSLVGSENEAEDMAAYLRAADAITQAFDCLVVIIHHCGIDGSRPRGHTSQTGAADVQIAVQKAAGNVVATVEFAKDMAEGTTFASRLEVIELGADQDGDQITSCAVVPVEDGDTVPPSKAKKQPKGTIIALRALREAIDDCGEVPPGSSHIPANVKVVTSDQWRRRAYAMGISDGGDRANQTAFKKAFEHAVAYQLVGTWNGLVWLP